MFGVIGEVAGKLFGTDKAVNNLVDKNDGLLVKAGSWIGNFNYTDEEKAEADALTREWGLRQLEAIAPFKVVQRILAFSACAFWILTGINVLLALWVDALTKEYKVMEIGGEIKAVLVNPGTQVAPDMLRFAFSDYVFWPVIVVFALYFCGGVFPRGLDKIAPRTKKA